MSTSRSALSLSVTAVLLILTFHRNAGAFDVCKAPQEITRFWVKLPAITRAVRSHEPLVIVAIGSSSTEGVGASDSAHTYPSLLRNELHRVWPDLPITVINKGVAGEMAFEMLARFERDVLPYHPQLVIWQTGSNQALRSNNIAGYSDTLKEGLSRLKATEADVVLMDPQFAPKVIASPIHMSVVDSIRAVARDANVAVFQRFAIMRHWILTHQFTIDEIVSSDGIHMNNASYGCIAHLLANSLVATASP